MSPPLATALSHAWFGVQACGRAGRLQCKGDLYCMKGEERSGRLVVGQRWREGVGRLRKSGGVRGKR